MAKLRADTAALVAAQLTQARMALTGGILAGRKPGTSVNVDDDVIETTYKHYLAFLLENDPKSTKSLATLDLSEFAQVDH